MPLFTRDALDDQLFNLLAERAFLRENKLPCSQADFASRQQESGQRVAVAAQEVAGLVPGIFESYHAARLALDRVKTPRFIENRNDIESQLTEMLGPNFLAETPWFWLSQIPRYLKGIAYRIEKLASGGQPRDESQLRELSPYIRRWRDHTGEVTPELIEYRWMLEEQRISVFAQSLGTSVKISPQRLEKQWAKIPL